MGIIFSIILIVAYLVSCGILLIIISKIKTLQAERAQIDNDLFWRNKTIEDLSAQEISLREKVLDVDKEIKEKLNKKISLLDECEKYQKLAHEYEIEYTKTMAELSEKTRQAIEFNKALIDDELETYKKNSITSIDLEIDASRQDLLTIKQTLEQLQKNADTAVELAKHNFEEQQQLNFYKLQLSDSAISDIKHLRSIEPLLKNPEPLNKVIWKTYYEKPYTDLVGRVIGMNKIVTGIYKITNIDTKQCYIGQAVDIASRWKQHIKRGIGADAPTQNKLYPAMNAIGPENFVFEVIEICVKDKLNTQEDYWQDFYKAKEFGYSIK